MQEKRINEVEEKPQIYITKTYKEILEKRKALQGQIKEERKNENQYETRSRSSRIRSRSHSSTSIRSCSPYKRTQRSKTPLRRRHISPPPDSHKSTDNELSPQHNIQPVHKGGSVVEVIGKSFTEKTVHAEAHENVHGLPLPASIEMLLGEEGTLATSNSVNFHESLVKRWAAILQTGLSLEIKSNMIKKQGPPLNCSLLVPPKLNEEVIAAMNESGIKRDKRIKDQQVVLASAITIIGTVLNHMIHANEEQHIEALSDSSKLLCDLFHENSVTRRSLILPGLNKDMKELVEQTPISEYLFGDTLQDKVNAIKAVKKSGQELKNTPAQNKPAKQVKNLNYRGPQRPQMLRPSGPKMKPKRPIYTVTKPVARSRRSPPKYQYQSRRQDHQRR